MKSPKSLQSIQAVFDETWYLSMYPDVAAAGLEPWEHYRKIGLSLGRPPNREFDGAFHKKANPDFEFSGGTEIQHDPTKVSKEGRNPDPTLDSQDSIAQWPVRNADADSLTSTVLHNEHKEVQKAPIITHPQSSTPEIRNKETASSNPPSPDSKMPRVVIVVCHYRHPELAQRMLDSLQQLQSEIKNSNAELFIVNDSPEDHALNNVLDSYRSQVASIGLTIVKNKTNLGFVKSSNLGIRYALDINADVLLLNSDAVLYPGTLSELIYVAYADPMIGFVSPRSNNATICTLSLDVGSPPSGIKEFYEKFTYLRTKLPRFTFTPTVVGFCMYAKGNLLSEIGPFDEVYGMGYNEENDIVMRANRMGYRAVIANHCAAWHDGESSFASTSVSRVERDRVNRNTLITRYPEYNNLVQAYFSSPELRAERILVEAFKNGPDSINIAFDLCNVGEYHNGTFEAAKRIIREADLTWPEPFGITCYISDGAKRFHGLKDSRRLRFVEPHTLCPGAHAIIRIGQPFAPNDLRRLFENAPVVAIFMLDTISWDCGYLAQGFDERIWRLAFLWADFIFTNSEFTKGQILSRFPIGAQTAVIPLLHSTNVEEYRIHTPKEAPCTPSTLKPGFILIVGNKFYHKGTDATARHLGTVLPHLHFAALGSDYSGSNNVTAVDSGNLSDASIDWLYEECSAVIFPSHYEGFGFPVLHALARKKPIFVRASPLYSEISNLTAGGAQNIHTFSSLSALSSELLGGLPLWQETQNEPKSVSWADSATKILECVESLLNGTRARQVAERLRCLDYNNPSN
jgi:GT2 family glycosyltransferase